MPVGIRYSYVFQYLFRRPYSIKIRLDIGPEVFLSKVATETASVPIPKFA